MSIDEPSRGSRFTFEAFDEIEPHAASALIKGVLPARGVAFIAGPSSSGKTFLTLDILLKVAAGEPVLGRRTLGGGVIYIAAEDPDGVRLRIKAARQRWGLSGLPLELVPVAPNLLSGEDVEDLRASIVAAADRLSQAGHPLRAVCFDTWSQSIPGGEENGSPDISRALHVLTRLSAELHALMIVVAHTGKDAERGIRGWSGQITNADAIIMVDRDKETAARTCTLAKVKNGVDGAQFGFALDIVEVGLDEDGDPVTSCVVEYCDVTPNLTPTARLTGGARIAADALGYLVDNFLTVPAPLAPGVQPGWKAVAVAEWKARSGEMGLWDPDDTDTNRRQKWHQAKTKVRDAGLVRLEGQFAIPLGALGGVRP